MRAVLVFAVAALAAVAVPAAPARAAQAGAGLMAYTRDPDGPGGPAEPVVYLAAADGTGERAYATGAAPALSGSQPVVAYSTRKGGALQLVSGRLDDPAATRQVTALPDREDEFGPGRHGVAGSAWSPGASWLALRLMEGSTTTLGFVRPDGTGFVRHEFGHLYGSALVWRDEGSVAVGTDGGLKLASVDGGVADPAGAAKGDTPVAWLDADRLVVNDTAGITVLNVGTGERAQVLGGAVAWAAGGGGVLYTLDTKVGLVDPETGDTTASDVLPGGSQLTGAVADGATTLLEVVDGAGESAIYTFSGGVTAVGAPPPFAAPRRAAALRRLATGEEVSLTQAASLADLPAATPSAPAPTVPAPATGDPVGPPSPVPATEPPADDPRAAPADPPPGRSRFVAAVPTANDVSTDPPRLLTSLLLTALLMLLITFPAELFNNTLEEHYDEVRGWFRLKPRGERPARTRARRVLAFAAYTAVAALLYGLLDPGFGPDAASARLVFGLAVGMVVVTLAFGAAPLAYARRRYRERGALRVLPGTLAVGVVCVAISRLASFEPGYLYGIVGGFAFSRAFSKEEEGRNALAGALGVLAVSALAWVLWQPVDGAAGRGDPGLLVGLADSTLATVAVGGLEGLVIGLLPLRSLQGYALSRWSRPAWAAVFGAALFLFVHLLLRAGGEETAAPFLTWLALFAGFGVASVAFWGYFRVRSHRAG